MPSFTNKLKQINSGSVSLIGIPSDENSTYMRGPALAPPKIREILYCGSANLSSETGIDLNKNPRFHDFGDLSFSAGQQGFDEIEGMIGQLLEQRSYVLTLGGDHAITFPIIKAYAKKYPTLNILHFDAHPDLYDNFENNPLSHASPFARIMENKLAASLTQIGIRTLNDHQREQVKRFNVNVIEMKDFKNDLALSLDGPLYLSIDMDALDPAYAPGVSHHEPGGLATRDIIQLIQRLDTQLVGADIVEYNPKRDLFDMTAMVAAKLLKEVAAKILLTNNA